MTATIPILAFHAIEEGPAPLCIPPEVFTRQIRALASSGCRALTVSEVAAFVGRGEPFPERAVALTFDDGYASTLRTALPVLAEAGFVASLFPATAALGRANGFADGLRMLWRSEVLELRAAGWEIGGHTHTHRPLPALKPKEMATEISRSTGILEDLTGEPVRSFAFPYGRHDAASRALAASMYDCCLAIGAARVTGRSRLEALERVDAWYARRPGITVRLHGRVGGAYLATRRLVRAVAEPVRRLRGEP